jgi:bis(5'-nucleosyl)-tetraphosphatase (symmetrical)
VAEGIARPRADDTLEPVLKAPDAHALLEWLRMRPLMHAEHDRVLVHAGLLPQWTVEKALALAAEVSAQLRGRQYREFLSHLYGSEPTAWDESLTGHDRTRVIVNAMTRMRFCTVEGVMEFRAKGGLEAAPPGYCAWFDVPGRKSAQTQIVCGHWSALGLRLEPRLLAIDTGCIWGGSLSAVRLEDGCVYQAPCAGYQAAAAD